MEQIEIKTKEIIAEIQKIKDRAADPETFREITKDCDRAIKSFEKALSDTKKIFV